MDSCVEELRPAPSPWDVFLHLAPLPHVVFFDSSLRSSTLGQYSFIAADPFEFISSRGTSCEKPFIRLSETLRRYSVPRNTGLPPFQGGVAGLFGYDLGHHIERLPRPRFDEFEVPDVAVGLYDWVVAFDHISERVWLISTGLPEREGPNRRHRAETRLGEVKQLLRLPPPSFPVQLPAAAASLAGEQYQVPRFAGLFSNFDEASYPNAVRCAIEYVHAGDCFQVNIAQRLLTRPRQSAVELYWRLRERNQSTFGGYLDLGDFVIASSSPERFVRLDADSREVETRPIKGTRPRGNTSAEDECRKQELQQSAKDRAENVMIVDLLRNDLGRVCVYGSVRVAKVCGLETYPFVHHLVSEVRGKLREGLDAVELLRAAFPGGSVTGAPKIRAMEIIAELEPHARGAYCGSLGYIGFDGSMDTNILIRTFTIGKGWIQFPVGGGIVADSDPEREYEETWHKAAGLLRALER